MSSSSLGSPSTDCLLTFELALCPSGIPGPTMPGKPGKSFGQGTTPRKVGYLKPWMTGSEILYFSCPPPGTKSSSVSILAALNPLHSAYPDGRFFLLNAQLGHAFLAQLPNVLFTSSGLSSCTSALLCLHHFPQGACLVSGLWTPSTYWFLSN